MCLIMWTLLEKQNYQTTLLGVILQGKGWTFTHIFKTWSKNKLTSVAKGRGWRTRYLLIEHLLCQGFRSVQLLSHVRLCDPMNRCTPGLPVHHQLPEFTQTHVHRVSDAIQPSHPLLSSSPPAPNPSQHKGLFQWVNSLHEVAKVLEFQLQHQSFQWAPRTDLL